MRKLTLNDRFLPHQYSRIENEADIKIPDIIKDFISEYPDDALYSFNQNARCSSTNKRKRSGENQDNASDCRCDGIK